MFKSFIKKFFKKIIPTRNVILLESVPDFSDSMINVYNEFLKRHVDNKYKIVWFTDNGVKSNQYNTTSNKFLKFYYLQCAKVIISSNRILYKQKENQKVFYITHGNPAKQVRNYYYLTGDVDYLICFSKYFEKNNSIERHQPLEKCFGLGLPRNDKLFENVELNKYFGNFKKYIFWYPTVKEFKGGRVAGNGEPIPFLTSKKSRLKINEVAKKNDVAIIAKIHFGNKDAEIESMSNLFIITNDFYKKTGIHHYSFLGSGDALVTDYSSVFYDYLLVNKPICLIWNDIDDYKANPGLTDDFYLEDSNAASKVYNIDEFCNFINAIGEGKDSKNSERVKVIQSKIGQQNDITSQVCDFILEKINYGR